MSDAAESPAGPKATDPEDWAVRAEQLALDQALLLSPREGWTARMAQMAGRAAGFTDGETELLLPHGPADLAALLARRHDARALLALRDVDPGALKIRERIAKALEARLDAAGQDEAAVRRCMGYLALPANAPLTARLAWESADALWRWAGDVATDENYYSKRVLLAGILSGALAIRISSGRGDALRFVHRRIADVMRFEQWRATTKLRPYDLLAGAAHALGRLRYGRAEPKPELRDAP